MRTLLSAYSLVLAAASVRTRVSASPRHHLRERPPQRIHRLRELLLAYAREHADARLVARAEVVLVLLVLVARLVQAHGS